MKCLERNKRTFYYATLSANVPAVNASGQRTGEYIKTYTAPTAYRANISEAKGNVYADYFGLNCSYDKVIVTDDMNCPITESSVLWVDYTDTMGKYDYVVRRKAVSLNCIAYAIARVEGA